MTLLDSYPAVEDALWRYADAYQVRTATVTTIPSGRASGDRLPFRAAFLDRLDERSELKARLAWLDREEQIVVLRWYVEGAKPEAIARDLGRSVRHVYRLRARAVERLVDLGRDDEFADADVAEFTA